MVTTPELGECLLPLLMCLEDGSSPPEDKTDAYLRLADDLAKEDKQFVQEVCNFSARLLCVLTRDITSKKNDLSQAALQAVGYCLYQEQIVSSLQENEMSKIIQDLCNLIVNSEDKNLCTRALWSIGKQHLSVTAIEEKLPVILKTVEHALLAFASTTVEKETLEVIYRLITQLPSKLITSTAGQWSKLVYPLLISSAHKIREKAIGILELGVSHIVLARDEVVVSLIPDLKGGMLAELTKSFSERKGIFALRAWAILITILGESLHKSGSLINEMLKIPEQGFKSSLPDVQSMSYSAWISLIDNFAISPSFIGSSRKIKLLMMPLLLSSGKASHKDIELGRLQAWWHLVCTIKTKYTGQMFSEICVPLLHYFFNVNFEPGSTPLGHMKDGMQELTMPVTPVAGKQTNTVVSASPITPKPKSCSCSKKTVVFNKAKFPDAFVKQVMLLSCEMLMETLAVDTIDYKKSRHLTEHLEAPILPPAFFRENELFFLAVVKSALCSCANHLEDSVTLSIWTNLVNRIAALLQNGDPKDIDDVMAPLFFVAHEIMTSAALSPALVLKFLDVLTKLPTKCLLHSFALLSSVCSQGKPIFLLADILFSQLSTFKGSYVDERFHVVFENLIDAGLDIPSGKLTTVNNLWLSLEGLASSIDNVEDMWRFWSKVTCSVSDIVTKTSDINQGDSLEHDFSLMISLLTFPFKQLFTGGLPGATAKELGRDLAEFFQLFARCASVVPTAEANSCIEDLSNNLLPAVSQEKCKNVRFLDGICNFIAVMVDGVDFSAQNTAPLPTPSAGRASLTTNIKSKPGNVLGNLDGLVSLSAKVLSVSYEVDQHISGSFVIAPAVMVLAGALSKFFAHLTAPEHIKETIGIISKPLASFTSYHDLSFHVASEGRRSTEKKYSNAKFFAKIEKLWTDILTCLQSRYTAPFDSELLGAMSELLESTFCHPRRQFRNQTIMFWNAAFAHANHLDYPISLRTCLQTVLEKTPLTLPGWDTSKLPSCDPPATLQDSEEMTPKENIIKPQVVMLNSPKRKHGSSSPGKIKGSFLHKALSADNNDRVSPFKSNVETSASKRKSSAGANVRRKLPLSLDSADDKDFVVIAPSPKKKRLLTEHQKEVRKTKKLESGHPPLYNMLDQSHDGMQSQDGIQSQDGTQFSEWMQTLSSENMKIIEAAMGVEMDRVSEQAGKSLDNEVESVPNSASANANGLLDKNANNVIKVNKTLSDENTPAKSDNVHQIAGVDVSFDEYELSPEFIPSSQTTDSVAMRENLNKRLPRLSFQSLGTKKTLPGCCPQILTDSESEAKDADNANSENSETKDVQERDVKERSNVIETSGSPQLDGKKRRNIRLAKTSPVSSRTRRKSKPFGSANSTPKTKAKSVSNPVVFQPEASPETKPEALCDNPFPISSNVEEGFSDHQLDDTQILEEAPTNDFVKCAPIVVDVNEGNGSISSGIITDEICAPSSPVTNSSIKLVQSKNTCVSSPLHRPSRGFNSPAASPTTGILKRNKGKVDTPSPPGKIRHVSFAFPLREEKEISSDCLEQDMIEEDKAEPTVEMTLNFTSIKAAEIKSSARTLSPEDCIFPDLVDCSTPVELILPSLATSRWSRGLGHLVHAQNIRTVGNLSALSEDQVQNLPIRSPKVSTLRRVLRNFHETRASKSPKVLQQREIKEISEEENQAVEANKVVTVDEESNEFTDECSDDKKSMSTNEVAESSSETVAAPINEDIGSDGGKTELDVEVSSIDVPESRLPDDSDKMLTPKRSRALVKPTTLFESECSEMECQTEILNGNANAGVADDLSNQLRSSEVVEANSECGSVPVAENSEENQKSDSGICRSGISSDAEKPSLNGDNEMDVENTIPIQDTVDIFVAAVGNLAILKTKEELSELSFDTLFLCHEQLQGVLSNVMSAVKSKCE